METEAEYIPKETQDPKPDVPEQNFELRALALERDFSRLSETVRKQRFEARKAQIQALEAEGAMPRRVFSQIAGEYSRADNIFCGINGEADHQALAYYLRTCSQRSEQPHIKAALGWLAEQGEKLAASRRIVKDFLILDQLTDPLNYRRTVDKDTPFFNSSLFDIDSRVMPTSVRNKFLSKIKDSEEAIRSWESERQQYAQLGRQLLPFINPLHPESYKIAVETGCRNRQTGEYWLESISNPDDWISKLKELLSADRTSDQLNEGLNRFMDRLTAAQAVLEAQYFYIGMGLIRAAVNKNLPEGIKKGKVKFQPLNLMIC